MMFEFITIELVAFVIVVASTIISLVNVKAKRMAEQKLEDHNESSLKVLHGIKELLEHKQIDKLRQFINDQINLGLLNIEIERYRKYGNKEGTNGKQ